MEVQNQKKKKKLKYRNPPARGVQQCSKQRAGTAPGFLPDKENQSEKGGTLIKKTKLIIVLFFSFMG